MQALRAEAAAALCITCAPPARLLLEMWDSDFEEWVDIKEADLEGWVECTVRVSVRAEAAHVSVKAEAGGAGESGEADEAGEAGEADDGGGSAPFTPTADLLGLGAPFYCGIGGDG